MTESTSNVEFAHRVEILEAAGPALVAIATAWSGSQAAKWDAERI